MSATHELTAHRWGLGLRLFAFNRWRLLGAWAGVAVAVTIMFVQMGLLRGILESQAMVADLARGDLVVMHKERTSLHNWTTIDAIHISRIAALPMVRSVTPVYEGVSDLRDPATRQLHRIGIVAFPADSGPLAIGDPAAISAALQLPGTVLFDSLSRNIYGKIQVGDTIELGGANYRVGGFVHFGADIISDGTVVMSKAGWLSIASDTPLMGVIRLKPGVNVQAARRAILDQVPNQILVATPAELRQREIDFTLRMAPIGIVFGIGVLAGFVVGAITCYQTLFGEIVDRLPEYATLRAMGFPDMYLQRVIYEQAVLLALGGFFAGLVLAWIAERYIAAKTALPVQFDFSSLEWTLVLTGLMSLFAGRIAMRLLADAQPAELY